MKNIEVCEYCGSRIFETDRCCVKCGAPVKTNIDNETLKVSKEIYSALTEKIPQRTDVKSNGNQLLYTYYHDPKKDMQDYYEKWKDANWGVYQKDWDEFAEQFINDNIIF